MYVHLFDEKQKSVLDLLSDLDAVKDFYLAGGTSIAIQYGHRESVDFDFFREAPFDVDKLLAKISANCEVDVSLKIENTLLFHLNEISCSFFKYPYPLLATPMKFNKNITLARIPDIAAMKLSAISTRGTKRDFVDLYFICKRDHTLQEVVQFYQKKFDVFNHDLYHLLKSLTYFGDAESDPMPKMHVNTVWQDIKTFFFEEANKLMA